MPTRRQSEYKILAKAYLQQGQGEKVKDAPGIGGMFGKYTPKTHAPRLRYLKFKSEDLSKTVEFYQILGMNIDYRVNIPLSERQDKASLTGTRSLVAFSYPAPQHKHTADEPNPSGLPLTLMFQEEKPQFQLVFECVELSDKKEKKIIEFIKDSSKSKDDKEGKEEAEARKFAASLLTEVKHNYEYLVIYVHMLSRLHKKLVAKGFETIISPIDISETKLCIVKDPNGLEVRLHELNDAQCAAKKTWICRVAYYTIPIHDSADSSQRYEKLFTPGGSKAGKRKKSITEEVKIHNKEAKDLQSFRTVDSDDFVLGLSRTAFIWMGNELRSEDFTMCFVQKKELGGSSAAPGIDTPGLTNGLLAAVGFQVASQENFLSKQRSEKNSFYVDSTPISRVPGVGVFQKLFDAINKFHIELYVPGSGREAVVETTQARKKEKIDFTKPLTRFDVERITMDPPKLLEAKLRFPSEGAIERTSKWSSDDESSEDEPVPPKPAEGLNVGAGPELKSSNMDFTKSEASAELTNELVLPKLDGTSAAVSKRKKRRFKDKAKSAHF